MNIDFLWTKRFDPSQLFSQNHSSEIPFPILYN
jgi:hypothetical protein